MKIAFINIYQGEVERGVETYVQELSRRLSRKHEVSILSFAKRPGVRWPIIWRAYLDPFGIQTFWYTLKLIPTLIRERFDIVIPVNGGWQPALVRLITWVRGGKMVISGQSGIGWDDRNNLWCFPDCFVALSDYAKKWVKRANPFVRVVAISNGVDVEKFSSEKNRIRFNLEKPIILCVAALTKSKRLDLTIKAVSKLKKGSLLIVGKGEEENSLRSLGKKLLGDRFEIRSFEHIAMPRVYKSADIFTFPTSPKESFGIVMVEAMASGLPVVVTDDPIRHEIVGDAGYFVDVTDTEKYLEALRNAIKGNYKGESLKQAEKFDWDKIAEQYCELFKDLIR